MLLIRDLTPSDINSVYKIIRDNWNEDIAGQAVDEMTEMFHGMSKWPPHYYVAEIDKQVVGCGGFKSAWLMSNAYELIWINIHKDFQDQGIGKAITLKRIDQIKKLGGTFILLCTQKPEWFQQFGFTKRDIFYPKDDSAEMPWILMSKQLGPVSLSGDRKTPL